MFFGGNKNINKKLGAFILAFVFVVGIFSFNDVSAKTPEEKLEDCSGEVMNRTMGQFATTEIAGIGYVAGDDCTLTEQEYNRGRAELNSERAEGAIERGKVEKLRELAERYDELKIRRNSEINERVRCYGSNSNEESIILPGVQNCKTVVASKAEQQRLNSEMTEVQEEITDATIPGFWESFVDGAINGSWVGYLRDTGGEILDSLSPLQIAEKVILKLVKLVNDIFIELAGTLLRFTGIVLNTVIVETIEGMSDFLSGTSGEAVEKAWEIIRDLINILFIFSLLFISISTIIKGMGTKTKSLLVTVIASALLINFSYFFTSVLIDASNFATVEMRNIVGSCKANEGGGVVSEYFKKIDGGMSNCIINNLKLQTALDPSIEGGIASSINPNGENLSPATLSDVGSILISTVYGVIFLLITSFLFLTLAIMLIIRFIMLILLLITSPVMFLGWILPNFSSISKDWFKKLNENLIFPPAAFLFIYISITISGSLSSIGTGIFGSIINFLLTIGFMFASIMVAKKAGSAGSGFATKYAGMATTGLAARASSRIISSTGRNTIGRGSAALADKINGTGFASNFARDRLKNISTKSFDARNTKTFQGVASKTGLTGAGAGSSLGYREFEAEKAKRKVARNDEFGNQTQGESREVERLTQDINEKDTTVADLKKRKGFEKDIESDREEMKDLTSRLQTLTKGDKDYEIVNSKAKEVAERIDTSRQGIKDIEKRIIRENSKEIEKIEALKQKGKDRQKSYKKNLEQGALGRFSPEKLRNLYRGATDSNKNEALRMISDKVRNKDGEDGAITKIIKSAKDANNL